MTQSQNDITIRSLSGAEELDILCALSYTLDDELAHELAHDLARDLARGLRRPQWMWVALRGGLLAGRAAWWGSGDDAAPSVSMTWR